VKLLASPFQEEGELMLLMFLGDKRVYSICFPAPKMAGPGLAASRVGKTLIMKK
jgi:hypothetical protein